MRQFLFISTLFFSIQLIGQINVLIIESDDQSNQAVGAFGNPFMVTPNIDKLAAEGTSFTSAYNMGCWSPAVCVPSRMMLIYGKYLWKAQKINARNKPISMPEIFKQNGYETYMTGKWHAWGNYPKNIFDTTGTITEGQLKTYKTSKGHITNITGDEAVNYIRNYKKKKPFFAYVAFNAPHVPRETSQNYYDLYPIENIELPPSVKDGLPLNKNVKYQYTNNPLSAKTMKKRVQQNNAMVTHMDKKIGDIIKALKDKKMYNNTIIVFMSDHGISFGENNNATKVAVYEPNVTAPLIIRNPKDLSPKKIKDRVYLQDIVPTLIDILNLKTVAKLDFKSLKPLIEKQQAVRETIYLAMFNAQRAIIKGDDKLILFPETKDLELYNLDSDPWETNNLINTAGANKKIKGLLKDFLVWQKKAKDTLDITTTYSKYFN